MTTSSAVLGEVAKVIVGGHFSCSSWEVDRRLKIQTLVSTVLIADDPKLAVPLVASRHTASLKNSRRQFHGPEPFARASSNGVALLGILRLGLACADLNFHSERAAR